MSKTILQAQDIKKSFGSPDGGTIDVLRGVNLSVSEGESISLRGESGAGKTTFLNILACLENPTDGKILWDGESVESLSNSAQAKLRGKFMGFVFQNYVLVPELNALENVELAARISGKFDAQARKRAADLLDSVGLSERMKHLSSQLSGGERQRVAIARALMNSPRIILADEPTGNLDETTGLEVMDMFLKLCREQSAALLLITHNPDFAARAARSLKLAHGIVE